MKELYIWCPDCYDSNDEDGCWEGQKVLIAESNNEDYLNQELEKAVQKRDGSPLAWEIIDKIIE